MVKYLLTVNLKVNTQPSAKKLSWFEMIHVRGKVVKLKQTVTNEIFAKIPYTYKTY